MAKDGTQQASFYDAKLDKILYIYKLTFPISSKTLGVIKWHSGKNMLPSNKRYISKSCGS